MSSICALFLIINYLLYIPVLLLLSLHLFFPCCSMIAILHSHPESLNNSGCHIFSWLLWTVCMNRTVILNLFEADYFFCLLDMPFLPDWADFCTWFSEETLTPVNLCTCTHMCMCMAVQTYPHKSACFPSLAWLPKLLVFFV